MFDSNAAARQHRLRLGSLWYAAHSGLLFLLSLMYFLAVPISDRAILDSSSGFPVIPVAAAIVAAVALALILFLVFRRRKRSVGCSSGSRSVEAYLVSLLILSLFLAALTSMPSDHAMAQIIEDGREPGPGVPQSNVWW